MENTQKIQELKLALKVVREQIQYQENFDERIRNN